MKRLRISFAAALIFTGLVMTSFLRSETRRLTTAESAAIGACASRYYVCNGQCQNSPAGEARTSCEAECMRAYNACVNASVRPLPPTEVRAAPSPSVTTTKPVATIAPRGVVPKQAIAGQTPTPVPRNVSSQRAGGPTRTVNSPPQPTIVPQSTARRLAPQPTVAAPTPTPMPPNFSRRPIGGTMRAKPTPTISPQGGAAVTASPPTMAPHRSASHRKSHRRHRSKEASPTPTPTSQPTPET